MSFGQRQQYAQRGGPPMDSVALRRKEEQRRRQQEYAQALAQQVAQREQQKQRERELDRRPVGAASVAAYQQRGNFGGNVGPPPPTVHADQQHGFFDGLGQSEYRSRTSFARGQRQPEQPPPWQQPTPEQPPFYQNQHQHQQQGRPPSAMNYAPPPPHGQLAQPMTHHFDVPGPWSTNSNANQWPTPAEYHQLPANHSFAAGRGDFHQFQQSGSSPARDVQPAWFPSDAQSGLNSNGFGVSGPGYPAPPSPAREAQQPQPPQQFGRRIRTDINGGGESRKMQQQLELQSALQLQIEEKNRQKLEAKRRKEEEDRKEMQRLAAEQREIELEQQRIREEKRRRAEEEAVRAQQAAAAVAVADQKARAEQQQRYHGAQHRDSASISVAPAVGRASPPRNPFVDSRAHLFQDASAPQLPGNRLSASIALMAQQSSPRSQFPGNNGGYGGNQSPGKRSGFHWQQPDEQFQQQQQQQPGDWQNQGVHRHSPGREVGAETFQQPSQPAAAAAWQSPEVIHGVVAAVGAPPVDPTDLMRQYDAMRQELARQQQLMEQLHRAQSELQLRIQSQQQQGKTVRESHRQVQRAMALPGPGVLKSLDCDSKLVYFSGAILHDKGALGKPDDRKGKRVVLEPLDEDDGNVSESESAREELRDSVDELVASSTAIRPLRPETCSLREDGVFGNQELRSSRAWVQPREREPSGHVSSGDNNASSPLAKSQRSSPARASSISTTNQRSSGTHDDFDTDDGDDALEFFVRSFPASSGPRRSASESLGDQEGDDATLNAAVPRWQLSSLTADESDSDDASLDGEQLEALFERNLRRHEILLGFQRRARGQRSGRSPSRSALEPTRVAWAELHHQLEENRKATGGEDREPQTAAEPALVGSSRWMPSVLA